MQGLAGPEREREKYDTYPATQGWFRCCQDIPRQIPKDETACINTKKDKPMSQQGREPKPEEREREVLHRRPATSCWEGGGFWRERRG